MGHFDVALRFATTFAGRVDGHAFVNARIFGQRFDDDERVDVVLFQDFVADVGCDFTAVLQPVNVHRFGSSHFGIEANQLAGLDARVLNGAEERWRNESPTSNRSFLNNQIGAAFSASASVFGDCGEDARVFHKDLSDGQHGFGTEIVDLELGRVLDGEVLAEPGNGRSRVAFKFHFETGTFVLKDAAGLDLLGEKWRNSRFLILQNSKFNVLPIEKALTRARK